jgi:hypothetical protein
MVRSSILGSTTHSQNCALSCACLGNTSTYAAMVVSGSCPCLHLVVQWARLLLFVSCAVTCSVEAYFRPAFTHLLTECFSAYCEVTQSALTYRGHCVSQHATLASKQHICNAALHALPYWQRVHRITVSACSVRMCCTKCAVHRSIA